MGRVLLSFSPLKFEPRKGVPDVTTTIQEQDEQRPPESIEKAAQRSNEDSPPSLWGNKCKAKKKWKKHDPV